MTPPLTEEDLTHIRRQANLIRYAIQLYDGDELAAFAAMFTGGVEGSLDCQISELDLSDRMFSICRDREDE